MLVKKFFEKAYVGFVGSQPTLLLLHTIFRQASKSNNVGCDPTNPIRTLFYSKNFFTNILIIRIRRLFFCERKSENVGEIEFLRHFLPHRGEQCNVILKFHQGAISSRQQERRTCTNFCSSVNLSPKWQTYPICSWYHCVRLFTPKMTVSFACG